MEVHKDNHIYIDKRKVTGVFKCKICYKVNEYFLGLYGFIQSEILMIFLYQQKYDHEDTNDILQFIHSLIFKEKENTTFLRRNGATLQVILSQYRKRKKIK